MTSYMPDLDCYETGEWDDDRGDSTDCPQCGGSGIDWPGSLWEPEEPCTMCDGTGVTDCNCPGLCAIHRAHTLPEPGEPAPWTDPWAGYTEPPF